MAASLKHNADDTAMQDGGGDGGDWDVLLNSTPSDDGEA